MGAPAARLQWIVLLIHALQWLIHSGTCAAPKFAPVLKSITETTDQTISTTWSYGGSGKDPTKIAKYEMFVTGQLYRFAANLTASTATFDYKFDKLLPLTRYNLSARAWSQSEPGPCSAISFADTKPGRGPRDLQPYGRNSTAIGLLWKRGNTDNYVITYRVTIFVDLTMYVVNTTELSHTFLDLRPARLYTIHVGALPNDTRDKATLMVRTLDDAPWAPPSRFIYTALNSSSVELQWEAIPRDMQNGAIITYLVDYSSTNCASFRVQLQLAGMRTTLHNLAPQCLYNASVRGCTAIGCGPPNSLNAIRTMQAAPVAPPANVTYKTENSTSALLKWETIPEDLQNGVITAFEVLVIPSAECVSAGKLSNLSYTTQLTSCWLTDLKPYCYYDAYVKGCTTVQCGPFSTPLQLVVVQQAPLFPPGEILLTQNTPTDVSLTWSAIPIEKRNGIITNYNISVESSRTCGTRLVLSSRSTSTSLAGLKPFCRYSVFISGCTSAGCGPRSELRDFTSVQKTPTAPPADVSYKTENSTSALLKWGNIPEDLQNGVITTFVVQVNPSNDCVITDKQSDFNIKTQLTSYWLTDLKPYCYYYASVQGCTAVGCGPLSLPPLQVLVVQQAPLSPPGNITIAQNTSTDVSLIWSEIPTDKTNGIVIYYNISVESSLSCGSNRVLNSRSMFASLVGLKPSCRYSAFVSGCTSAGCGPSSELRNFTSVQKIPSAPPANVAYQTENSTSAFLKWENIPEDLQNGVITAFVVHIIPSAECVSADKQSRISYTTQWTSYWLTDLKPYCYYSASVQGCTAVGCGPSSTPLNVVVVQQAPLSPPGKLILVQNTSAVASLTWQSIPLDKRNGIVTHYNISVETSGTCGPNRVLNSTSTFASLTGLKPFCRYSAFVSGCTSVGCGPRSELRDFTSVQKIPSAPPANVAYQTENSTSALLKWENIPEDLQNGVITAFVVHIIPSAECVSDDKQSRVSYTTQWTSYWLTDLKPYCYYSASVQGCTAVGCGPSSTPLNVVVVQQVPLSPPGKISLTQSTSTDVSLTWSAIPIDKRNGIVTSYNISVESSGTCGPNSAFRSTSTSASLAGLKPFCRYSAFVSGCTSAGCGPRTELRDFTSAQKTPSVPPANVTYKTENSTSALVKWGSIPEDLQNGVITAFVVRVNPSTECVSSDMQNSVTYTAQETSFWLTDLKPYCYYNIAVQGCTAVGCGTLSAPLKVIVVQQAPLSPPGNLNLTQNTPTDVSLTWQSIPIDERNGIITHYNISVESSGTCGPNRAQSSSSTEASVTGLKPFCRYSAFVSGCTSAGCGPRSELREFTTVQKPPTAAPENFTTLELSPHKWTAQWSELSERERNGVVTHYEVTLLLEGAAVEQRNATEAGGFITKFENLNSNTKYTAVVRACNLAGSSNVSRLFDVVTLYEDHEITSWNLTIANISSERIFFLWSYNHLANVSEIPSSWEIILLTNGSVVHRQYVSHDKQIAVTFEDLTPGTTYYVRILAQTSKNLTYAVHGFEFTTPFEAPGKINVMVIARNTTAVTLSWMKPSSRQPLYQYSVHILNRETGDRQNLTFNSTNDHVVTTIDNLSPATKYEILLTVRSDYGVSRPSEVIEVTTSSPSCSGGQYIQFSDPYFNYVLQEIKIGEQINVSLCEDNDKVAIGVTCELNATTFEPSFSIFNNTRNCSRVRLEVNSRFKNLHNMSSEDVMQALVNLTSQPGSVSPADIEFIWDLLHTAVRDDHANQSSQWRETVDNYGKIISNIMSFDQEILAHAKVGLISAMDGFSKALTLFIKNSDLQRNSTIFVNKNTVYKVAQSDLCQCWMDSDETSTVTSSHDGIMQTKDSCAKCDRIIDPGVSTDKVLWFAAFRNGALFASATTSNGTRTAECTVLAVKPDIEERETILKRPITFALKAPKNLIASKLSCATWDSAEGEWTTEGCSRSCAKDYITCSCNSSSTYFTAVKRDYPRDRLLPQDTECWTDYLANAKSSDIVEALNDVATILANERDHDKKQLTQEMLDILATASKVQLSINNPKDAREEMEAITLAAGEMVSKMMDVEDVDPDLANKATKQMEEFLASLGGTMKLEHGSTSGASKEVFEHIYGGNLAIKISIQDAVRGANVSFEPSKSGKPVTEIEIKGQLNGEPKTFIIYKNGKLFKDKKNENQTKTEILGAQVIERSSASGRSDFSMKAQFTLDELVEPGKYVCSYWNYSLIGWHTDGCQTLSNKTTGQVICSCNHLTHFAVLLNPFYQPSEELTVLTMVGLGLSTCCLGFVIITFLLFRRMRKNDSQRTLFSLSLSLLCLNLFFLGGIDRTSNEGLCTAMAIFIHYFLLTSFAWTLVEAVLQYYRLVKVLDSYVSRFMLKSSLPAWGIPALLVGIIYGANQDSYLRYEGGNGSERWLSSCWVNQPVLYYGVIAPVASVIVVNSALFSIIMYSLLCGRRLRSSITDRQLAMLHLKAGVSIFILLGITWVIGFIGMTDGHPNLAFQAIFCILCSLTGVFIMVFHNLRERAVRDQWRSFCCTKKGAASGASSYSEVKMATRQSRASASTIDITISRATAGTHQVTSLNREASES